MINDLSAGLGAYSVTYVKLPVLFNRVPVGVSQKFIAGTANVVNCLVYPGQGIYMQDTGNADFNGNIGAKVTGVVFINIWNEYHCFDGEVHCGTTTRRTIDLDPPWWDEVAGWQ